MAWRVALFSAAAMGSMGVTTAFFPAWLKSRGLSAADIGLVLAWFGIARIAAGPAITSLAARWGSWRKPLIFISLLGVFSYAAFEPAQGFWAIMAVSLAAAFVHPGMSPLLETIILAGAQARGLDYPRLRLWGSVGFILATLAMGQAAQLWSLGTFVLACVLTFGLAAATALMLPDLRPPAPVRGAPRAGVMAALRQPGLFQVLLAGSLIQASHHVYYGFSTIDWQARGFSNDLIGVLWAVGVLAEVALFALAGPLLNRFDPRLVMLAGGGIAALRWALHATGPGLVVTFFGQLGHAASFGLTYLGAMMTIQKLVPAHLTVAAQSLNSAVLGGVMAACLPPLVGVLYGAFHTQAFLFGACLALAGSLLLIFTMRLQGARENHESL